MKTPQFALTLALAMGFASFAAPAFAQTRAAQEYPNRAIRMVVPFPAGGPTDLLARVVGQRMAELMRQPVVIDNKPGANTIIGADAVAKAAPDGYTLLMAIDNTVVMNQFLYTRLPYDPVKDFEPIGKVATTPLVIMTHQSGPESMQALLAQAKSSPGTVSYGFGTFTSQLSGELLKTRLGKDVIAVSYKGSAGTTQGLLTKDVTFTIDGITTAGPHLDKGTLRPLARLSRKPIPTLPKVPALADLGVIVPDIDVWMALLAPKGTPQDVVAKLNRALIEALASTEVQEKLRGAGLLADPSSPQALSSFMASEAARWQPVIAEARIRID